jgi:hypothetical protein
MEESMNLKLSAVLVLALALCLVGPAQAAYVVGDPVADFSLKDASGNTVYLFDYEGMVIWLVFWTDT